MATPTTHTDRKIIVQQNTTHTNLKKEVDSELDLTGEVATEILGNVKRTEVVSDPFDYSSVEVKTLKMRGQVQTRKQIPSFGKKIDVYSPKVSSKLEKRENSGIHPRYYVHPITGEKYPPTAENKKKIQEDLKTNSSEEQKKVRDLFPQCKEDHKQPKKFRKVVAEDEDSTGTFRIKHEDQPESEQIADFGTFRINGTFRADDISSETKAGLAEDSDVVDRSLERTKESPSSESSVPNEATRTKKRKFNVRNLLNATPLIISAKACGRKKIPSRLIDSSEIYTERTRKNQRDIQESGQSDRQPCRINPLTTRLEPLTIQQAEKIKQNHVKPDQTKITIPSTITPTETANTTDPSEKTKESSVDTGGNHKNSSEKLDKDPEKKTLEKPLPPKKTTPNLQKSREKKTDTQAKKSMFAKLKQKVSNVATKVFAVFKNILERITSSISSLFHRKKSIHQ